MWLMFSSSRTLILFFGKDVSGSSVQVASGTATAGAGPPIFPAAVMFACSVHTIKCDISFYSGSFLILRDVLVFCPLGRSPIIQSRCNSGSGGTQVNDVEVTRQYLLYVFVVS